MTEEEVQEKITKGVCPSCGGKLVDDYEIMPTNPPFAQHKCFTCKNCSAEW